ncbi:hypothetical protein JCM11641_007847 [Rhodosporidiobolus odoratus]
MESFQYQSPTFSPTRSHLSNLYHPQPSPPDPYSPSAATRPLSSSGPSASGPFTATLPPVHENSTTDNDRPTLVGFDELTGEDLNSPPGSSDGLATLEALGAYESGSATAGLGSVAGLTGSVGGNGALGTPSFSNPFARPPSAGAGAEAVGGHATSSSPYDAPPTSASSHLFFNPQTVNPSVNARNTRPMTAPSRPGYLSSSNYSAAPSSFYAPPAQQYEAFQLPGSLAPGQTVSAVQYGVDSANGLDYEGYRAREFSLPDVAAGEGGTEGASPTSSTPFFYTPPSVQQNSATALRPATASTAGAYYPAILEGGHTFLHPLVSHGSHPLMPGAAAMPPPGAVLDARPGSSSGPAAAAAARRRSSGSSAVLPPPYPAATGPIAVQAGQKSYNFLPQTGQQTKRPRRRYDEIERLYNCDYPGCTKAYGTLNHLNSHKTMQKHGPKSTPAQFKEMRKAWRERKKSEAAANARARAANPQADAHPTPGMPSAFTVCTATLERPRPSTSAGEYHYTMPAPFLAAPLPGGAPVLTYAHQPQATLSHHPHQHLGFVDHQATHTATWSTPLSLPQAASYDPYGSALRPVTAPSYYMAPAFNGALPQLSASTSAATPGMAQYAYPRPAPGALPSNVSPIFSSTSTLGAAASADRRFSLPASTSLTGFSGMNGGMSLLGSATTGGGLGGTLAPPLSTTAVNGTLPDSPEMKMPQPRHGYQQASASLLGAGSIGPGSSIGVSAGGVKGNGSAGGGGAGPFEGLSLGLATGGSGKAELVLGGGVGEDDEYGGGAGGVKSEGA